MAVDPVTGTSDTASTGGLYSTQPTRTPKQSLDGEAFMNLLVTQLRNQDPSSPMDTNQMIAQTTQLAMMEKLTNMDSTNQENFALQMRMAAANLVGHTVSYIDKNGDTQTGVASSVSFAGSVPVVTVGDAKVNLDSISGVVSPAPVPTPTA
ncbi:flagellar hook assembly protein FlgD [Leifsonia poae]|uniref:flagellar hook assembly protein FlgD n=1 Tax=Leifsonia poae TaxID=110933 RepID=UPI001CBBEFDC|nr:flagellar hook capping FlgD N-terminal domain-containing protein [Leifsonia poae]